MSSIATEPNGSGATEFPVASCQPQGRFSYLRLRRNLKPIDSGWGSGGAIERKRIDMPTIRQWAEHGGNLAVRTGRQSSCFVVDVDPRHGGDVALAALIAEHGDLPETYTVRTGRGGWHYYFRLPDFEVHSNNTGLVGPGIDVKGEGSYVVAAGSVKPDGSPYVALDPDAKIAPAPEWLLAVLRGRAEHVAERRSAALEEAEKVPVPDECCEALVARAVRSIEAKMDKLAKAPEGKKVRLPGGKEVGWDEGYFLLAARLIEIARWPFASFTMADAERVFSAHVPDAEHGFDPDHKWERGVTEAGTWLKGSTHRVNDHVGVLDKATGLPLEPAAVASLAAATAATEPRSAGDKFESAVADQMLRLKASEEAKRRLAEEQTDLADWEPIDLTSALHDGPVLPDVGRRADGVGVFYPGKLNVVYGESEGGKTWVALCVAAQVMADDDASDVIYLDYEDGDRAIAQRLLAINVPEEMILRQFRYVNPPGPFTDRAFERIERLITTRPVRLVVIDATTEALAREGLDSNSDTDIAEFYNRYPKRIAALGPAVVVIDHVTKSVEGRGQQIGSQMKKAGVDGVAYAVEPMDRFTKGKGGSAMVLIGKDKQGGVREHGVFGGEGRLDRFATFQMDECGVVRLTTVKAAETKIEQQFKRMTELEKAIREFAEEHDNISVATVKAYLRDELGMKFSNAAMQDVVRTIKAERAADSKAGASAESVARNA